MHLPCDNPCVECAPSIGGGRGPVDPANPFVNLSSEAPDVDVFIGRRYTPVGDQPPIGDLFYAVGCLGWCVSTVSQQAADICALNQEVLCLTHNWPPQPPVWPPAQPPTGQPPVLPPVNPRLIYWNSQQSCSFPCPDGSEFTFVVPAHTFSSLFNQATVDALAYSYACNQAVIQRMCFGSLTPALTCSNSIYSGEVVVTTVNLPVTITVLTELPAGLVASQNPSTLFISGTPTVPGDYVIGLMATDTNGNSIQKSFSFVVFGFSTPSTLGTVTPGTPYATIVETSGSVEGPVNFSIVSGILPAGLTLNPLNGVISGNSTETEDGNFYIVVRASAPDSGISCDKEFLIPVEVAADCPDWNTELIWNAPNTFSQDGATVSFTPNSAPGDTFDVQLTVTGVFESQASVLNQGNLTYNGPGCNCNLNLQLISTIPGGPFNVAAIDIFSDVAGTLLTLDVINDASGSYDYPFALPDTLGLDHIITVQISWGKYYLAGASTLSGQGVITNI